MTTLEKDLVAVAKDTTKHIYARAQALKILAVLQYEKKLAKYENN